MQSLDAILSNFNPSENEQESSLKDRECVTIWLPATMKARYDRLQEQSGRRFSKKIRELLLAAISRADTSA